MPKNPINYFDTMFYKIVCKDLNITECYVGHTTNFIKRKNYHKNNYNNENNKDYSMKVYDFIRNNGGWDNWDMILIEKINCEDKLDACRRERKFIEELKASLNVKIPSRTNKEYRQDNKDLITQYNKEFYKNNREYYTNYQKEYYETKLKNIDRRTKIKLMNKEEIEENN